MSKNAPDTRNKIDKQTSNKKLSKERFNLIKGNLEENPKIIKLHVTNKESKGSIFKKAHGYSKTQKRLMDKYSTNLEGLRGIRKEARLVTVKNKKAKHDEALAGRKKSVKTVKGK